MWYSLAENEYTFRLPYPFMYLLDKNTKTALHFLKYFYTFLISFNKKVRPNIHSFCLLKLVSIWIPSMLKSSVKKKQNLRKNLLLQHRFKQYCVFLLSLNSSWQVKRVRFTHRDRIAYNWFFISYLHLTASLSIPKGTRCSHLMSLNRQVHSNYLLQQGTESTTCLVAVIKSCA